MIGTGLSGKPNRAPIIRYPRFGYREDVLAPNWADPIQHPARRTKKWSRGTVSAPNHEVSSGKVDNLSRQLMINARRAGEAVLSGDTAMWRYYGG